MFAHSLVNPQSLIYPSSIARLARINGYVRNGFGQSLKLAKSPRNLIVSPRQNKNWEVSGTFNPGAVSANGAIHLLYRAVDAHGISRFGYARTSNTVELSYRSPQPVMEPTAEWEEFGCEDPRITCICGSYYVTYTAFSRAGPRIALASTKDFTHFEKYGLVGPERDDKDCVIFPEPIRGKIAILHRLDSRIQIAYFEDLDSLVKSQEFWKEYVKKFEEHEVMRPKFSWEQRKIGVGAPPIKTERGWLVIYHGVSVDQTYRAGAILLDLNEPEKHLARTNEPILEPIGCLRRKGCSECSLPCGSGHPRQAAVHLLWRRR
jgi:predicted GH43/DUF377 family glycosyl hydrolase